MTTSEAHIDLAFQIQTTESLPSDHGYYLFGAIARLLPFVHEANGIGIFPISGQQVGERRIALTNHSRLTVRVGSSDIAKWLLLAGKSLDIGGTKVHVGIPEVRGLIPGTALRSRLVTTKNCIDQARFEIELKRQFVLVQR